VAACVKQTITDLGRIDILVNNAGIGGYRPFLDWTEDDYDKIMETNGSRRGSSARRSFRTC